MYLYESRAETPRVMVQVYPITRISRKKQIRMNTIFLRISL